MTAAAAVDIRKIIDLEEAMDRYRISIGEGLQVTLAAESEQAALDNAVQALGCLMDAGREVRSVSVDRSKFSVEIVRDDRTVAEIKEWLGLP